MDKPDAPISRRFGTYKAGDPNVCMVVGCERKALYRSLKQTKRGFCAQHKDRAVLPAGDISAGAEFHARSAGE